MKTFGSSFSMARPIFDENLACGSQANLMAPLSPKALPQADKTKASLLDKTMISETPLAFNSAAPLTKAGI